MKNIFSNLYHILIKIVYFSYIFFYDKNHKQIKKLKKTNKIKDKKKILDKFKNKYYLFHRN